jgi:hypothetical protein
MPSQSLPARERSALIAKVYTVSVLHQRLFCLDFQAHSQLCPVGFFSASIHWPDSSSEQETTHAIAHHRPGSQPAHRSGRPERLQQHGHARARQQRTRGHPYDATAQAAAPAVTQTAAAQAAAAAYDFELDVFHPVIAKNGMVASEQELATQIGVDILKAGGNAVDAAVAVGFALAVALPNAGNIGGGGFMMVHDARSGKDIALDFREVAPRGASRNMYLDAAGKVIDGKSLYTHYAVGVPGTVA